MGAFDAALDFATDMIELSVLTLGKLVDIQLADLSTIVEHQNVSMQRITEVRDVAAMLALQREYSDGFWKDRANALTAAKDALQVASQRVGKSWTEMVNAHEASPTPSGVPRLRDAKSGSKQQAKRSKKSKEATLVAAVTPSPTRPKAQRARSGESSKGSARGQADPRPEQAATRTIAKKRGTRARKGATREHRPPVDESR
jgi:hypothetical protein